MWRNNQGRKIKSMAGREPPEILKFRDEKRNAASVRTEEESAKRDMNREMGSASQ